MRSILHGEGFALKDSIFEVLPGDVIAWEFAFEDDKTDITGHVMLIEVVCTLVLLLLRLLHTLFFCSQCHDISVIETLLIYIWL